MSTAAHLETGKKGEEIAQKWLKSKGFSILECNYWKKWGELDIIAKKDTTMHFVEVKTARCDMFPQKYDDRLLPEENMHARKRDRIARAIQTYLEERRIDDAWTVDLCVVWLNTKTHRARVRLVEDIVL